VVLVLTGHTLKDPDYTIQYHRGELPSAAEVGGLGLVIEATRRNAIRVEASADQVLRELERFS
jgi:threonine synthase